MYTEDISSHEAIVSKCDTLVVTATGLWVLRKVLVMMYVCVYCDIDIQMFFVRQHKYDDI